LLRQNGGRGVEADAEQRQPQRDDTPRARYLAAAIGGLLGYALLRATPWGVSLALWLAIVLAAGVPPRRGAGHPAYRRRALAAALAPFLAPRSPGAFTQLP
jgi:hypothetical protein